MSAFFSGLWAKIKADAINAWLLIGGLVSGVISNIDNIAAELGAPDMIHMVSIAVHDDVVWVSHWTSLVTWAGIVARLHKLIPSPPKV